MFSLDYVVDGRSSFAYILIRSRTYQLRMNVVKGIYCGCVVVGYGFFQANVVCVDLSGSGPTAKFLYEREHVLTTCTKMCAYRVRFNKCIYKCFVFEF